jgi:acylphosphatase
MHLIVEGRVQGVGFRYFVADSAIALDIKGWVRNRWDESVEVMAEGERSSLERFLGEVRRGPPAAYVSQVKESWAESTAEFTDFRVVSSV